MALVGCREAGIDDPITTKNLIVFVEIDRCATDAIQSVTGCKLGKRTLKFLDYGKLAATFYNQANDLAVRVVARYDARERALEDAPSGTAKKEAQTKACMRMPDEDLFSITLVRVRVPQEDLPGHPVIRVSRDECGKESRSQRSLARNMHRFLPTAFGKTIPMSVACCHPGLSNRHLHPFYPLESLFWASAVGTSCFQGRHDFKLGFKRSLCINRAAEKLSN